MCKKVFYSVQLKRIWALLNLRCTCLRLRDCSSLAFLAELQSCPCWQSYSFVASREKGVPSNWILLPFTSLGSSQNTLWSFCVKSGMNLQERWLWGLLWGERNLKHPGVGCTHHAIVHRCGPWSQLTVRANLGLVGVVAYKLECCLFLGYSGPCAVYFVGFTVSKIWIGGGAFGTLWGHCLAFFLFRMRRCGFGVEAVFDFVLSLDLLPRGWFAEWSTL